MFFFQENVRHQHYFSSWGKNGEGIKKSNTNSLQTRSLVDWAKHRIPNAFRFGKQCFVQWSLDDNRYMCTGFMESIRCFHKRLPHRSRVCIILMSAVTPTASPLACDKLWPVLVGKHIPEFYRNPPLNVSLRSGWTQLSRPPFSWILVALLVHWVQITILWMSLLLLHSTRPFTDCSPFLWPRQNTYCVLRNQKWDQIQFL